MKGQGGNTRPPVLEEHTQGCPSVKSENCLLAEEKKYKPKELGSLYPIATSLFNRRSVFTAEP